MADLEKIKDLFTKVMDATKGMTAEDTEKVKGNLDAVNEIIEIVVFEDVDWSLRHGVVSPSVNRTWCNLSHATRDSTTQLRLGLESMQWTRYRQQKLAWRATQGNNEG